MRLLCLYLARQYRLDLHSEAKRLGFATTLVGMIFFLVAMWPAFEAGHRSTYEKARYSLMVNGPLTPTDLADIDDALGKAKVSVVRMNVGGADGIRPANGGRTTKATITRYEPSEKNRLNATYFNSGVRLKGDMGAPDAWGLDYASARTLRVGLGDRVQFTQLFTLENDSRVRIERTGTISAIYQPSTVLRGLLVPFAEEDRAVFRDIGADHTHLFYVVRGDSKKLADRLRGLPQANNWLVETLCRQKEGAENAIAIGSGDSRSLTKGILLAGALAYASYSLFDEQRRFARRSKSLAVAASLGTGWRAQLAALALEQALFAAVSCSAGIWLGSWLLWQVLRSYVPTSVYAVATAWALFANLLVVGATAGVAVWRLRRLPIARLLTSE